MSRTALSRLGIFLCIWLAVLVGLRLLPQTAAILDMRLSADAPGSAQWYFDRGGGMSEAESVSAPLKTGANNVRFHLPTGVYRLLRFDPINNAAHVRIESLLWTVPTGAPAMPDLSALSPSANIARTAEMPSGLDVWPVSGNDDPQMVLKQDAPLDLTRSWRPLRDDILAAFEAAVLLALVGWLAITRLETPVLVCCGMLAVAGLIVGLAAVSTVQGSVHPDEFSHLGAYQYYTEHVLPPAVEDPATLPSTSVWGYSYLYELNASYWLAGRVMAPLAAFFSADLYAARTFQLFLWGVLCCVALAQRRSAIVLSVLLLSPQVWYVFAYYNSDAFPLTVAMLAVVLCSGRSLPEWIRAERRFGLVELLFAVCLGLLLVCKANYVVVVPGLLLWLGIAHFGLRWRDIASVLVGLALLGLAVFLDRTGSARMPCMVLGLLLLVAAVVGMVLRATDRSRRSVLLRLTCLALLGIVCALPRIAWDIHVNGGPAEKAHRIELAEESRARPDLRPSAIADGKGGEGTGLRSRGIPLTQVLFDSPYQWVRSSAQSAFGVYGYMNVFAPPWTYVLSILLFGGLVLLVASVLSRRVLNGGKFLLAAAGMSFLVTESSVLHSWIDALQPQGRYLFPELAFLALMLAHCEPVLPQRALRGVIAGALLVGAFSFVIVAYPAFVHG